MIMLRYEVSDRISLSEQPKPLLPVKRHWESRHSMNRKRTLFSYGKGGRRNAGGAAEIKRLGVETSVLWPRPAKLVEPHAATVVPNQENHFLALWAVGVN